MKNRWCWGIAFNPDTEVQKHRYPVKSFLGSQKNKSARKEL